MGAFENEFIGEEFDKLEELCKLYAVLIDRNATEHEKMNVYTKLHMTVGKIAKLMSHDPSLQHKSSLVHDLIKIAMGECYYLLDLEMMQYFDFVYNRGIENSYGNAKWSDYEFAPVDTILADVSAGEYYISSVGIMTCATTKLLQ